MPPDPPTMARTYKSYKAPGTRPPQYFMKCPPLPSSYFMTGLLILISFAFQQEAMESFMQVEQSPGDCHKILYVRMCEKVHQNTLCLTPWRPTSYMQDSKNKKIFLQRKKKTIGVQLTKEKDFDH